MRFKAMRWEDNGLVCCSVASCNEYLYVYIHRHVIKRIAKDIV